MENGLQIFIRQNPLYSVSVLLAVIGVLLAFSGGVIIIIIRFAYKYIEGKNERSDERFKAGEKEFERLNSGQERIEEQIERKEETAEIQRKEIKDSVGAVEGRLFVLETKHKNNHKDD